MQSSAILEMLNDAPVIAAVKDDAGLKACLASDARVVFVLYGSVLSLAETVGRIKAAGKTAIVHLDLIDGLAPREVTVDFVAQSTAAAGIISTKAGLVRRARQLGLCAIRRFFLLDSMALDTLEKQLGQGDADLVEVLPGAMPKVLAKVVALCPLPTIAGGLITDKEDVVAALRAGCVAVSSTNPAVWKL